MLERVSGSLRINGHAAASPYIKSQVECLPHFIRLGAPQRRAMRVLHLYLIVLSALLPMLGASSTRDGHPPAEMKQLLLADVNQAADQQEMPALRSVRQLGNGRRFGGGRFGGGGLRRFGGGGLPFGGGGRRFGGGRRRFANPGFYPQPFGFFG